MESEKELAEIEAENCRLRADMKQLAKWSNKRKAIKDPCPGSSKTAKVELEFAEDEDKDLSALDESILSQETYITELGDKSALPDGDEGATSD